MLRAWWPRHADNQLAALQAGPGAAELVDDAGGSLALVVVIAVVVITSERDPHNHTALACARSGAAVDVVRELGVQGDVQVGQELEAHRPDGDQRHCQLASPSAATTLAHAARL